MITLLPRVPAPVAAQAADVFTKLGETERAVYVADLMPDAVRYAATGGTKVTELQLRKLRNSILSVATASGFGSGRRPKNFSKFDGELALLLVNEPLFASGEALRDDVWSYMGCFLAPDVVFWRWDSTLERYVGGVRNAFQRLWLRARLFDRGDSSPDRWGLVSALTEDAFLQIIERPGISSDPTLCLAIGEAWVRASKQADGGIEGITRKAIMEVRVANMVRPLALLPGDELQSFMDGAFGVRGRVGSSRPEGQPKDESQPERPPLPAPDFEIEVSDAVKTSARMIRQLRSSDAWMPPLLTLEKIASGNPNLTRNEIAYLRVFISQTIQSDSLRYANEVIWNFTKQVEEEYEKREA